MPRHLISGCFFSLLLLASPAYAVPWWHRYTPVVSSPSPTTDLDATAAGASRGGTYFSGWYGYWHLDDQRRGGAAGRRWKRLDRPGLKRVIYYDSGEVGDYAGFFDARGEMIYNGWSLPWWKGQPVVARWFGLAAFMADVDWAPWPTANAYGLPAFTLPDGTPADDLYAVLSGRRLDGTWDFDYSANARITDRLAQRSGLAKISSRQEARQNVAGKTGWRTVRLVSVDYSNPQLRDYRCRELARTIRMVRPDGVHIDNHGDLNVLYPEGAAFGQWSVHQFHIWLKEHFRADQLAAMGIDDTDRFDITAYIREKPFKSRGKRWHTHNRRWTDDLIWKCFLISKIESGVEFHHAVYRAAKDAARQAKLDCMIGGNTVPAFTGRTLLRGACDIACFEWKTGQMGPQRGCGLPPLGRVGYVTRLGAAISAAGYCWPSIYVPKELSGTGHENLHKVLAFDCLANRGLLDYGHAYLDGYSPGTPDSAGFVNRFVKAHANRISRREYLADVGLVYCPWTEAVATTVFSSVPEMFFDEYAGWATALSLEHRQWDVVLSDDLTADKLARFPLLVLPSILAITDRQAAELRRYVEAGGRLVATGNSGSRYGSDGYLMPRQKNALDLLAGHPRVRIVTEKPGCDYWSTDRQARAVEQMTHWIDAGGAAPRLTTNAPPTLSVNASLSPENASPLLSLDLTNHDLDVTSDRLAPAPPCLVTLRLPGPLVGRALRVTYASPQMDAPPDVVQLVAEAVQVDPVAKSVTLHLPGFRYAMLVLVEPDSRSTH
ncbi:MAG: hypothetical protein ACC645_12395 [Pirellulales bacterium]